MNISGKLLMIMLFVGCLFKMPYGYYQFIHWAITIGFGVLCYYAYEGKVYWQIPIYSVEAILFNPFVKFAFKRTEWQMIDKVTISVLVAIIAYDLLAFMKEKQAKT